MRGLKVGSACARVALPILLGLLPLAVTDSAGGQVLLGNLAPLNGVVADPAQTALFTGNGALGWIGDMGRNRVLVFDARTGNVVRTIPNVTAPGRMTVSPDRRTLAVVNVGTNNVSLIDTVTYAVRTFASFQPASFDSANNVVFSLDGAVGFIADYTYSNVMSFDAASGGFLRTTALIANAKPGHIALAPSGQLLAVVTTGLRSTTGDYIAVLRTDTLLPYGTGRLAVNNADFSTANNIVFTPNGTGYVASFGTGTLFTFDPVAFLSAALPVGLGPGAITLSPDGGVLAVNNVNSATLSLVDTATRRVYATVTLTRGPLNAFTQVEFSSNGALGYFAAFNTNQLIVFNTANGAVRRRVPLPGGPVQLFRNPERGLLYSFNTQARAVSLLSFVLNFPILRQSAADFTGLALSNPTDMPITFTLSAYDNNGQPLRLPGGSSVRTLTLPPKGQLAKIAGDLFSFQTGAEGWIQVTALDEVTAGFFLQGNAAVTYLNGGTVSGRGSTRLGFTRVMEGSLTFGDPATTEIDVVNPGQNNAVLNLTLFDATGQAVATAVRQLPPFNRMSATITALFPSASRPQTGGLVEIAASTEITGYELVWFGNSLFMLAGRDLTSVPAGPLYSAQFASGFAGDAFFTEINLVNTNAGPVHATVRLVDDNGQTITGPNITNPVPVDIPAKGAFFGRGSQVFGFPEEASDPNLTVGSIIVDASDPGLLGDVVFGESARGRFVSALPMTSALASDVVFSQVAEGTAGNLTFFTGLAILNPGSTAITVTVKVYSEAGRLLGSRDIPLAAGARTSRLLRDFVPEALGQIGGFVRLTSGGGFAAFELFGASVPLQFLASVPGQALQ